MSVKDCHHGGRPSQASRPSVVTGNWKLVPEFWQNIRTDGLREFPRFGNRHIPSPASPNAASVYRGSHAEVHLERLSQSLKILRTEALRLQQHRLLSPIAGAIIHNPHRQRLRRNQQTAYRLWHDLPTVPIERPPQCSQVWMTPRHKPPERVASVVVEVQRRWSQLRQLTVLPLDVRLEARRVVHLKPDSSPVRLKVSIPKHDPEQRVLHGPQFFPRYCPPHRSGVREGSTDISRWAPRDCSRGTQSSTF